MCVFLSLRMNKAQIKKQYDLSFVDDEYFGPKFVQSAFEFNPWPVIPSGQADQLVMMNWGLIPHWVKDEESARQIRTKTVNSRIETAKEKPSFRKPVKEKRCLVLADGFFEFRELNGQKYPYFIRIKDRDVFTLAGLYDEWINSTSGEIIRSFSILTTEANELMAKVHNRKKRMPVILNREDEHKWIDFSIEPDQIREPYPAAGMDAWTVQRLLTSRSAERGTPAVSERFTYPEVEMADIMNI
jgi:putative SOS response-associated peptidase YedK